MPESFMLLQNGNAIRMQPLPESISRGFQSNILFIVPESSRPICPNFEDGGGDRVRMAASCDQTPSETEDIREQILALTDGKIDICDENGNLRSAQEIIALVQAQEDSPLNGTTSETDEFTFEVSDEDVEKLFDWGE